DRIATRSGGEESAASPLSDVEYPNQGEGFRFPPRVSASVGSSSAAAVSERVGTDALVRPVERSSTIFNSCLRRDSAVPQRHHLDPRQWPLTDGPPSGNRRHRMRVF